MPAHALATAAVLTLSPPQLASLDQPTPSSSTSGPLDPLWHRLTRSPTTTARPTATSDPGPSQATSTGPTSSQPAQTAAPTSTTPRTTPAADGSAASTTGGTTPTGAGGAATPVVSTTSDRTQAASSQRVAQTRGAGSSTSLALTVLGMLVAAAAVAATTVRSWSRAGRRAPSAPAPSYQGRRRR